MVVPCSAPVQPKTLTLTPGCNSAVRLGARPPGRFRRKRDDRRVAPLACRLLARYFYFFGGGRGGGGGGAGGRKQLGAPMLSEDVTILNPKP